MPVLRVGPPGCQGYQVVIGPGALSRLPSQLPAGAGGKLALVADDQVHRLHGAAVEALLRGTGRQVVVATFPAGEASKTRETKARLEDELVEAGLGRDGVVVALGGGVATDLGGFVAATFLRGVPFVALPTTLLAMVDASVGGKTGVNHPRGKNLVGAFHQPSAVVSDLSTLATLPAAELDCGLAEMAKHALISGGPAELERLVPRAGALRRLEVEALADEVARSVAIKAGIVSRDPFDQGERAVLNAGHTIGHGLEQASGFTVPHGSAVAVGLVAEALIAWRLGLLSDAGARRVREAISALGLPAALPDGLDPGQVVAATGADKKRRGGEARYALLGEAGLAATRAGGPFTFPVPDQVALEALEELGP